MLTPPLFLLSIKACIIRNAKYEKPIQTISLAKAKLTDCLFIYRKYILSLYDKNSFFSIMKIINNKPTIPHLNIFFLLNDLNPNMTKDNIVRKRTVKISFGAETYLEILKNGTRRDNPINKIKLITKTIVILFSLELSSSFFEIIIQDINPKEILSVGNQKSNVLIVEIGWSQNIVPMLINSTNHSSPFSFRTNL